MTPHPAQHPTQYPTPPLRMGRSPAWPLSLETSSLTVSAVLTLDDVAVDVDAIVLWRRLGALGPSASRVDARRGVESHARIALLEVLCGQTFGALLMPREPVLRALSTGLSRRLANLGVEIQAFQLRQLSIPSAWQHRLDQQFCLALRQRQAAHSAAKPEPLAR